MVEYDWSEGARKPKGLEAQAAGDELDRIRRVKGELTPATVVAEARKKRNPLHTAFEWNDAEAARSFRVEQAKYLIRHVVIKRADDDVRDPVRAFVSVLKEQEHVYEATEEALADPFLRKQVLDRAKAEMELFRRKYGHLQELARVVQSIEITLADAA